VQALVGRRPWHGPAPGCPRLPSALHDRPRPTGLRLRSPPPGRTRLPRTGARGLDIASAPSASRHPPCPARSAPREPRTPVTRARGHPQAPRGGAAPGLARRTPPRAGGTETPRGRRATTAPPPQARACLRGRMAWPRAPGGQPASDAPPLGSPGHGRQPRRGPRWGSPVPRKVGLSVLAQRPPRWGRAS